jgi:hypothetical protein
MRRCLAQLVRATIAEMRTSLTGILEQLPSLSNELTNLGATHSAPLLSVHGWRATGLTLSESSLATRSNVSRLFAGTRAGHGQAAHFSECFGASLEAAHSSDLSGALSRGPGSPPALGVRKPRGRARLTVSSTKTGKSLARRRWLSKALARVATVRVSFAPRLSSISSRVESPWPA